MSRVLIFCEGVTDQIFIGHCINDFWGLELEKNINKKGKGVNSVQVGKDCQIVEIGGCEKLKNKIILDQLRDNAEEGGTNIVIFDADFSFDGDGEKKGTGNHGYKSAVQKLKDIRVQHSVEFDFYLWHNNEEDGEVEHLLYQLIPEDKKVIMDCIDNHHHCLVNTNVQGIRHADLKTRLGYYIYTLNHLSEPSLRDYSIRDVWDLRQDGCNDLLKFKNFLAPYFLEKETAQLTIYGEAIDSRS